MWCDFQKESDPLTPVAGHCFRQGPVNKSLQAHGSRHFLLSGDDVGDLQPPWTSPHASFEDNIPFIFVTLPAGAFPVLMGVAHFISTVVNVPLRP